MYFLLKKILRRLLVFLRYIPFDFAVSLRCFFYKNLFKKSGKKFTILDSVIIKTPENISIGNRVSIHQFSILDATSEIEIGDNTAIGSHVALITSSHNFSDKKKILKIKVSIQKIS